MYLAPLNYDRFFRRVFSHTHIAKAFLQDFLGVVIDEIELLDNQHFITNDAAKIEFDFRCKIEGADVIIDMQQWYKPDVVKRFYLYHCASTVLQLERLPEKKLLIDQDKRARGKDYKYISPVITLIWMVQDTFALSDNFITYSMSPQQVSDFLKNHSLWENPDIQEIMKKRNEALHLLQNPDKDLRFIPQSRLTFMFQSNIVKDTKFAAYKDWFLFAEKTRNKKNKKADFKDFVQQEPFKEIMFLINKQKLSKEDFDYIETEEEHLELVKRALKDEFDSGFDRGYDKGFDIGEEVGLQAGLQKGEEIGLQKGQEIGLQKAREDTVLVSFDEGLSLELIAKIAKIPEDEVKAILQKYDKI